MSQNNQEKYKNCFLDVCTELLTIAFESKRRCADSKALEEFGNDYLLGSNMAYMEVLSLLQNYARSFGIPLNELGLDRVDPENEILSQGS